MTKNEISTVIQTLEKQYVRFWEDIVNIESPTSYKPGVDAVGTYCMEKAKALGWKCEVHHEEVSGDAVCITMNPDAEGAPIALSGHMDTVHELGSFGNPPVTIEGDIMHGPGVTDCKGGIVASFMAMHVLQELGYRERPIKLLLESDEENSSLFSQKRTINWICEQAKDCMAFLNAERHVPGLTVLQRKGITTYELKVKGVTMHAMHCYKGVSAIKEMAYKVIELEKLQEADGITINCGIINGGNFVNNVPEYCSLIIDVRYNTEEEMKRAEEYIHEVASRSFLEGSTCTVTKIKSRVPMERVDRNFELLDKVNAILEANGLQTLEARTSGGGSDAADVTVAGIPVLDDFGTEGKYFHTRDEYGVISSLVPSAVRIAVIASSL